MNKNILLIGGAGYIGSIICEDLLAEKYKVTVIDKLWFDKEIPKLFNNSFNYSFYNDISYKKIFELVSKCNVTILTAAVVGDPACNLYPVLTIQTNLIFAKKVIRLCRNLNKKIVFFSTCSNYGIATDGLATEETKVNPISLYAKTKVKIEDYIRKMTDLDWIICRLSTVYGLSPRMRFDLTVNEFALKGYFDKYIDIFRPESYRPYIHVNDLSQVIVRLIQNFANCNNNIFNVGFNGENYQKITIAESVRKYIPDLNIEILKSGGDLRDYKVDFSKLHDFIELKKKYSPEIEIGNIINEIKSGNFSDCNSDKYYNTKPLIK